MTRRSIQSDPSLASSFSTPPIKLMRIRCYFFSRNCLLFNWHLIFCGCHFKREDKGLPFTRAGGGGGRGGEVKCHSVWWLCNVFWATDAPEPPVSKPSPPSFPFIQGTEISFSHPVHQLNAVFLSLSLRSRLIFLYVQKVQLKIPEMFSTPPHSSAHPTPDSSDLTVDQK